MLYDIKKYTKDLRLITKASHVAKIIQSIIRSENEIDKTKEHLFVIGLSPSYKIKYIELCSLGTIDTSLVNKREILVYAIKKNCPYLILAHNHPSNTISPSERDVLTTMSIGIAADLLDIQLIDHIIVTKEKYYSFSNSQLIFEYDRLLKKLDDFILLSSTPFFKE